MSGFRSALLDRLSRILPHDLESPHGRDGFGLRLQAIMKLVSTSAPSFDDAVFALRYGDGTVYRLDEVYSEFLDIPQDRRDQVLFILAELLLRPSVCETAPTWEGARIRLVPRLAPSSHADLAHLRATLGQRDEATLDLVREELNDAISIHLAYDSDHSTGLLGHAHTRAWAVSIEEAMGIAIQNLSTRQRRPFVRAGPGTWKAAVGDGHDAARVLLIDEVSKLDVLGEPVALAASRDRLAVTGSADQSGLCAILALAMKAPGMPGFITRRPVVLRQRRWVMWEPDPGDPLGPAFRELAQLELQDRYAAQKGAVEAWLTRRGSARRVATIELAPHPSGEGVCSVTRWPAAGGYMPQAEFVILSDHDDGEDAFVPWEEFAQLAGTWLHRTPFHRPPLWRADGPLPASAMHELRGVTH